VALSWEWDHQNMWLGVAFAWLKRHGGLGLEKGKWYTSYI